MADERGDDVLQLWQSQETEGFRMTPEQIHQRTEEMEQKLRRRWRSGYLVCGSLVAFFTLWLVASNDPIQRLGAVLSILGLAYMAWQIRQNRWRNPPPGDIGSTASGDFLRTELARQRDFHRGRTFWTRMLCFVPGPLVFFLGFARAQPHLVTIIRLEAITFLLLVIAAVPLNHWLAGKYQRQIDQLDRLQREP
ncbi:MAG TPA: hypothetical protein VEK57_13485 [Thermoanaerobaculia bacterium]|nr:hypothetical protein [Thermoanaerobaculia bacterium]